MADKSDLDHDTLKIGDLVLFKDVTKGCNLSVEGILCEDLTGTKELISLQDSIFCVHLQRQYSASRDLNAFLENVGDVRSIEDESAKKYLSALERGRDNEMKLNDNYMRKKHGQKVLFGEIIQLYHVKSGKYLVVVPDELAKDERENTHVMLDVDGNAFSWLQLCPRFKIDKDGDRVLNHSELYLKAAERNGEYIHIADRDPVPGHDREVNCALEATSWRLNIYQSSLESSDSSVLLASQVVFINDPETKTNLTVCTSKVESLDEDEEGGGGIAEPAGDEKASEFTHEFGDLVLDDAKVINDQINSNFLWFLESSSMLVGGPIKWKTDQVRFKHMNTGLYLKQTTAAAIEEEGSESNSSTPEDHVIFTTVSCSDGDISGTLFNINELNSTGKFLSNAKALQIGQGNVWIERGELMEDTTTTFRVKGTRDKSSSVSLIIQRFSNEGISISADDVEDTPSAVTPGQAIGSKEPLDVYVGLSARNYLQKYYDMTVVPHTDSVNTVWPSAVRTDRDFFDLVIEKTVNFSQGFAVSAVDIVHGIDKAEAGLCKRRQSLLREQNSLEIVLRMIQKLIPITERLDKMKSASTKPKRKKSLGVSDEEIAMVTMGQEILGRCFDLLYYSILNNEENQMYVADFMPVLLAHLSAQPLAGKCVTEMLSKNLELQETKIGTREIQIFVDKLRSSKMNAMYLQLLQACCSCEGEGVDGNQCKVATMLFSDTNDIIIELHTDYSKQKNPNWTLMNEQHLYILDKMEPGMEMMGAKLLDNLPALSLAWTTNSIDFSPLGLFGKLSVNIEDLFKWSMMGSMATADADKKAPIVTKKLKNKKKSSEEQKQAVANYFIAEMFLGAEMCMDRNYVAMHKLDKLFPYEVLVTIVKMQVSSSLKAAAVRLLMCLHVDRDPQATSKIPCLTRTWTDIKKHETPSLPYVEKARWHLFGLIQQLISQHVGDMATNPKWSELSWHMLRMLRTLVQFNFYGTNERMKDVIGPLITAIDRRKHQAHDSEMQTVKTKKNKGKTAKKVKKVEISVAGGDNTSKPAPSASFSPEDNTREEDRGETDRLADYTQSGDDNGIVSRGRNLCQSALTIVSNIGQMFISQDSKVNPEKDSKTDVYRVPSRYSRAPLFELDTMVEAVTILAFAQKVIEDRNISLLLRKFFEWETRVNDKASPMDLFQEVVAESEELTLGVNEFNEVMLDVLMFVHTPLVQSTLEVLMAHHSMRSTLLENAYNVQLLASHRRERQYKMVDQMLQQLEQNAETHELWGELETDAHHSQNKQTKDILRELIDTCRVRRFVLEFDEEFEADKDIQNLYRNLGAFDICMKVLGLLDSVEEDEDGDLSEVALNTRELCLLCNNLLYWFFVGNAKNQELGYDELDFFLETLDSEINSHTVVRALFRGNEELMRRVPHQHLTDLVDRIIKKGQSPHYLALFSAIPNVGEKNIVENQFEIVKTLTSPGRLQKVGCFLVSVDHPDYAIKRDLMAPFLNRKNVTLDELPPLLAYHLMFLEVLSGCTVGRLNVTTVEAKVQSVFSYEDIIGSMLDPGTMLLAKIVLGRFLFNAVIEVELVLPGLEKANCLWRLMESFVEVIVSAKDEIDAADKLGWEAPTVHRQKIEYICVVVKIIGGYFSRYYDSSTFKFSAPAKGGGDKSRFTKSKVNDIMVKFFHKIKDIHDLDSPRLSDEMKGSIYETLDSLKKHASKFIHAHVAPKQGGNSPQRMAPGQFSAPPSPDKNGAAGGSPAKSKDESENKLTAKYSEFLTCIREDPGIQDEAENENVPFIKLLEELPYIAEVLESPVDVRKDGLIKKLVSHIRENIKIINNQKRLDARVTKTSIWIIRAFRTMIENKMGMSIMKRDDEGGAEQDLAAAPVVNALNSCGATALCLDLIADGIDENLQLEAIKLGVGLLFKEGGALEVQGLMNNHLSKTNSELFFKQVRITLQKLEDWHNWNKDSEEQLKTPESILIVRFLQLMCEGHYLPNQDIMREQPNNHVSYNLLDSYVSYLNCLSRIPSAVSTEAAVRLTATILEVIQGPCEGNQKHFALDTELVESLNRLNRAKFFKDCDEDQEIELKKTSIDIFQGLLEGQGEKSVVYERVLSVIHLDIIQMMSKKPIMSEASLLEKRPPTEEQLILQTECVVLLQMLCNFKPSLYDELGISRNIEDIVGSGTAMIEIIWRGDIHRRFFHVPNICEYLAKSSKDALVENVDRSNAENKLIDFLARSHEMYREVKHQQWLTDMNMSRVFSRRNQNNATWITFVLSIVINVLFLAYYSLENGAPYITPFISELTNYINYLQIVVSSFTLILWLIVRSPVNYQTFKADGSNGLETILKTATDPLTVYYMVYLLLSFLGALVENYYCALLLLDIVVKNSTTRDVLNSIVTPRKQLAMGLLLEAFVIYIYSFYIFFFFRADIDPYCDTLYDCLKVTLSYGLQGGGGIADNFSHTTGVRLILDLSFFCVVLVILLNVIFGMIIDTFSSLRADKLERIRDTTEVCFICSIDKQIFDRASDESDGFKTHIKIDHNMWNYLYFIFMLWEQDKDDDDGLEQYVRRAIEAKEITWFPMNKAMRLDQVASPADIVRKDLQDSVHATGANLSVKFDEFQVDVSAMFQQLMQTLKHSTPDGNIGGQTATPMSALMEDGGDLMDGDMTARSGRSEGTYGLLADDNTFGKHVSLTVLDIDGLVRLTQKEMEQVSCRLVYDSEIYSIPQIMLHGSSVCFDAELMLPLWDNVYPGDQRRAMLQILHGLEGSGKMKFLGEIEIHAAELVSPTDEEERVVAKRFQQNDEESDCICVVRILSRSYVAQSFGREDDLGF